MSRSTANPHHADMDLTTERKAMHLKDGDRIVGCDGATHTVQNFYHQPDLGQGVVEFDTDTGLHRHLTGFERHCIYSVEVPR